MHRVQNFVPDISVPEDTFILIFNKVWRRTARTFSGHPEFTYSRYNTLSNLVPTSAMRGVLVLPHRRSSIVPVTSLPSHRYINVVYHVLTQK